MATLDSIRTLPPEEHTPEDAILVAKLDYLLWWARCHRPNFNTISLLEAACLAWSGEEEKVPVADDRFAESSRSGMEAEMEVFHFQHPSHGSHIAGVNTPTRRGLKPDAQMIHLETVLRTIGAGLGLFTRSESS